MSTRTHFYPNAIQATTKSRTFVDRKGFQTSGKEYNRNYAFVFSDDIQDWIGRRKKKHGIH